MGIKDFRSFEKTDWEKLILDSSVADANEKQQIVATIQLVPENQRIRLAKSILGLIGGSSLIRAKCNECVNYSDTKNSISQCRSFGCPLWGRRPYKIGAENISTEDYSEGND